MSRVVSPAPGARRRPFSLHVYRVLSALVSPALPLLLRRRLAQGKEDAARLHERLGRPETPRPAGRLVWIHAASVGEMMAILPLVGRLDAEGHTALVTTGTLTSAQLAAERLPARSLHQFVPMDGPAAARRFLDHWQPDLAIFCESEIWPNLVMETRARGIPMGWVNARMSARSFARWQRMPAAAGALLGGLAFCFAQSAADAERFAALGAPAVMAGNLKFDVPPLPLDRGDLETLRQRIDNRPVLLAASTHPGEEMMVLEAAAMIRDQVAELLTILVPRHPERGRDIADMAASGGMRSLLRSAGQQPDDMTTVYIADTLGELGLFYALAQVVFVGGSLVPIGGHNPIEPAKFGVPILHGPDTTNFAEIYAQMDRDNAAIRIDGVSALGRNAARLMRQPEEREALGQQARTFVAAHEGALDRCWAVIAPLIAGKGSGR